uniref:Uncharacterized protein n=1 Tax=Nelumbo nucifera TaxID=4432 RepID=A0A822ZN57_NELNU|nr:TPA_asm: hypothetical protein HUJ06_003201 [Nelumbo nucifera]
MTNTNTVQRQMHGWSTLYRRTGKKKGQNKGHQAQQKATNEHKQLSKMLEQEAILLFSIL